MTLRFDLIYFTASFKVTPPIIILGVNQTRFAECFDVEELSLWRMFVPVTLQPPLTQHTLIRGLGQRCCFKKLSL